MRATDAVRETVQLPGVPGRPVTTLTRVICPLCRGEVAQYRANRHGELFRRHKHRLPNGLFCLPLLTRKDPAGTVPAF